MEILIIGGCGFIGTHLTNYLVDRGYRVRVLSRKPSSFFFTNPSARYVYGDFLDDDLINLCLDGIDVVFQLVSTTVPSTSNLDITFDIESNVGGMFRFLEACVRASVKKVIFPSSGGTIYGIPIEAPISESHPTDPICSYAITKLMIEKYLRLFHHLHGLDYTILRIANPYGSGQSPQGKVGAIPIFLNKLLDGEPIKIWGDGKIIRDYIHVHDVVVALYKALNSHLEERVFNIGAGQGVSLNQLISLMQQITRIKPLIEYGEGRPFDTPINVLDIGKANRYLEWTPSISLEEGLASTWEWIQEISVLRSTT